MFYQIDEQLAEFARNIWRPVNFVPDATVATNGISESGKVVELSVPMEGPENDSERFFTTIWNSAKPFRWKIETDAAPKVRVTKEGQLSGDVGFSFRFVRDPKEADGKSKFAIPWEIS
jgi:hypothetical protein